MRRRFVVIGVVLLALIVAADWVVIAMARSAAIESFGIATTNLANGMAAQTARSLTTVDKSLQHLRDGFMGRLVPRPDRQTADLGSSAVHDKLAEQQRYLSGVRSLVVVDAEGRVVNQVGPAAWLSGSMNVSGEAFFRHFSDRDPGVDPGLFVGAPRQDIGGKDGTQPTWSSILAERLTDPSGAFAGVVLATISLSDMEGFFQTAMPLRRTVTVARTDGVVLVRYPHRADVTGKQMPDGAEWFGVVAAGGGSYLGTDALDRSQVLGIVRLLPGLPLVLETSVREDDALAEWRTQRIWFLLGGAAACVGTMLLLRLFALQVSRLAAKNHEVEMARLQLDVALSNIAHGICFFDRNQRLIVCNQRYGEIWNLPTKAMLPGASLAEIVSHAYVGGGIADLSREEYMTSGAQIWRSQEPSSSTMKLADGRTIAIRRQPLPDGAWVATHEDITERRRAEDKISFLAHHDALTGLPNRALLQQKIGDALIAAGRGAAFALLFLDLDRFKAVNDTLGHGVGDRLLSQVAVRLDETVRTGDIVARLGGDEFVVLQGGLRGPEDAVPLAKRILKNISAPYSFDNIEVTIGVSIGIAFFDDNLNSASDLLKDADTALYRAKAAGRGTFRFSDAAMDAQLHERQAMLADRRGATTRSKLELY